MTVLRFISKFGLEYCDLPTIIWNVSFLLRPLAVNIDSDHTRISAVNYVMIILGVGCYIYVYLFSMIWFVFWRCMETGELMPALIAFSLGLASDIGPLKLSYLMLHLKQVRNIVKTCLACDASVQPDSRFHSNLRKILRQVKKRAITFWVMMMADGFIYLVQAFLRPGRHLIEDEFIYYGLEPMFVSPNYEIALVITIVAISFACYSLACVTGLVIIIVGYVEAQMLAWQEELLQLWNDAEEHYVKTQITVILTETNVTADGNKERNEFINKFVEAQLKEIIRNHARNLDLLHQIESVLSGAMAIEFFMLIIGLIAELLGGLENTFLAVTFSFLQVTMDCLTGQRLADASIAFERAVFNCKWENFNSSNEKLVLLVLQISQKTMTLSAGGMVMLNFSTLMWVVRSVYSAYTTLRSSMAKSRT